MQAVEAQLSQRQSLQVAQELLYHTFSCISYLRGLFPEEAFESHNYHGTNTMREFNRFTLFVGMPIRRLKPRANPAGTIHY